MDNGDTTLLQLAGPCCRVARGGEHDLDPLFKYDIDAFIHLRIEQRHIYTKRVLRIRFALLDVFPQHLWVHRPGADKAESARIANCGGEAPTATPDHPSLNDRKLNFEQLADAIILRSHGVKIGKVSY